MIKLGFFYVLGCFLLSLGNLRRPLKRDAILLSAAMFFTVLADYFLIIRGIFLAGVCFFILVQLLYNLRYWGVSRHIFACVLVILPAALFFHFTQDLMIFAAAIYAQLFFLAICGALHAYKKKLLPRVNINLALIGMILFAACDIQVALVNAASYGINVMPHYGGSSAYKKVWLCYAPSQLLLALSGKKYKTRL